MEEVFSTSKFDTPPKVSRASTARSLEPNLLVPRRLNTDSIWREGTFRPLRKALGSVSSVVIMGGTITTLGVVGFVVFLWTGEGWDEGQTALSTWRYLILEEWITQAITLLSLVLQITNTAQASICTGLVAAMVLERHGVPLADLAEYSLIRSNNDGPLRLSWMLLSSFRKSVALQTFLVASLLFGNIAIQFTSTILVSDLAMSTIVGNARTDPTGVSATFNTLNQFHLVNQYFLKPAFTAFGEVPGSDPTPTESGVSDTGIVKRIHPFVARENRTTLRQYQGRAFVHNSRVVCLRPSIEQPVVEYQSLNDPSFDQDFVPYFSGRISYNQTFGDAGLFPGNCPNGSCFPSGFNCSISTRTGIPGKLAISGCLPSGRNAPLPSFNSTISSDPIANTSEVFLIIRNDIIFNTTFDNGTFYEPVSTSALDEWTTYNFDNGVTLQASLCFQQMHYDRAMVDLSTTEDLQDAVVQWNANETNWDTSSVRRMFGTPTPNGISQPDATARGIYSVGEIFNATRSSTTAYLTSVMITDNYNSFINGNVSMLLSPYGGGDAYVVPHVEYQALFADTLEETNRPSVAFQNLLTTLSGSIIDSLLSQLDVMENISTVSSVSILAPQRRIGLAFVLGIIAVNLTTIIVTVSLFLVKTEHTSSGNYWHAIAQIISDITQPILQHSTQATDDEVSSALSGADFYVRIARSAKTNRVQVVRCEDGVV